GENSQFFLQCDARQDHQQSRHGRYPCQRWGNNRQDYHKQEKDVPVLSGFLLSRAIRQNRDEQYIYSSGGSSYVSRPVWRTTSGD
ncbi:hypothetical protein ONJ87_25395, partial [Salmonella enterica subsp. enterica serovar Anatum]|nr:hypothetical protein [Salmonella enterica subsp. enterica serovar Anatum]